jgi:hypothetical protein
MRINTDHDNLPARSFHLPVRRDEPTIRRDHAIFGILLKLLDESPRPVGPRWPKKEEQKQAPLAWSQRQARSASTTLRHNLHPATSPGGYRVLAIRFVQSMWYPSESPEDPHKQNEVFIGILARGSASMRADQSDGPDFRLRGRPCQDGPDDILDA